MTGQRLITGKELERRIGTTLTTIWRWETAGQFPKRVQVNPSGTKVAWIESEVDEWIANRPRGMGQLHPPKPEKKVVVPKPAKITPRLSSQ